MKFREKASKTIGPAEKRGENVYGRGTGEKNAAY